eukprot:gene20597-23845_t
MDLDEVCTDVNADRIRLTAGDAEDGAPPPPLLCEERWGWPVDPDSAEAGFDAAAKLLTLTAQVVADVRDDAVTVEWSDPADQRGLAGIPKVRDEPNAWWDGAGGIWVLGGKPMSMAVGDGGWRMVDGQWVQVMEFVGSTKGSTKAAEEEEAQEEEEAEEAVEEEEAAETTPPPTPLEAGKIKAVMEDELAAANFRALMKSLEPEPPPTPEPGVEPSHDELDAQIRHMVRKDKRNVATRKVSTMLDPLLLELEDVYELDFGDSRDAVIGILTRIVNEAGGDNSAAQMTAQAVFLRRAPVVPSPEAVAASGRKEPPPLKLGVEPTDEELAAHIQYMKIRIQLEEMCEMPLSPRKGMIKAAVEAAVHNAEQNEDIEFRSDTEPPPPLRPGVAPTDEELELHVRHLLNASDAFREGKGGVSVKQIRETLEEMCEIPLSPQRKKIKAVVEEAILLASRPPDTAPKAPTELPSALVPKGGKQAERKAPPPLAQGVEPTDKQLELHVRHMRHTRAA